MSSETFRVSVISLGKAFGPLVVQGPSIEVDFREGNIHVRSGEIATTPAHDTLINSASPAALKVGDVVMEGPNKGWIYCKTKQDDVFLVAPQDSGVMSLPEAIFCAAQQKARLPNIEEFDAMYNARYTGALKGTFNHTGGSYTGGWYWSDMQNKTMWCHRFVDGYRNYANQQFESSLRCVRRGCSIF